MSRILVEFDHSLSHWEAMLSSPDWYLRMHPQIERWQRRLATQPDNVGELGKAKLYDFFEEHLARGNISLGNGSDTDADRKPVDTIVIHHTSNPPGMRPTRLSAIELIRLYAPYFSKPKSEADQHLKGKPIYSGHVRRGEQVFWPYHWIVRQDGRAERLLKDSEIGWHAGDWEINRRSVAIVLDGDYEWRRPSGILLRGVARLIKIRYGFVSIDRIFGHQEITPVTVCPSRLFLAGSRSKGWKSTLLNSLSLEKRPAA